MKGDEDHNQVDGVPNNHAIPKHMSAKTVMCSVVNSKQPKYDATTGTRYACDNTVQCRHMPVITTTMHLNSNHVGKDSP